MTNIFMEIEKRAVLEATLLTALDQLMPSAATFNAVQRAAYYAGVNDAKRAIQDLFRASHE